MTVEEVIEFIKTAEAEDVVMIREACKRMPTRIDRNDLLRDDIRKLCEFFPIAASERKGQRYDMTAGTYVRHVKELTDVITGAFSTKISSRGYPVWKSSDMLSPNKAADYKHAFHILADTILELAEAYGTHYPRGNSDPDSP